MHDAAESGQDVDNDIMPIRDCPIGQLSTGEGVPLILRISICLLAARTDRIDGWYWHSES